MGSVMQPMYPGTQAPYTMYQRMALRNGIIHSDRELGALLDMSMIASVRKPDQPNLGPELQRTQHAKVTKGLSKRIIFCEKQCNVDCFMAS